MNRTRRAAALAAAALLAGCSQQPVALGVAVGTVTVQAAYMALDDARAAGLDVPVDTVIVPEFDNRAMPAVRAADRFVSTPGIVAVMGHSNSAASLTAAPIYNQAHVVQIASHSTADLYSEAGPYSFRMVPPDVQQGRIIADFLARNYAGWRVALAYVNDDYGRGLRNSVLAALRPGAVEIVVDLPHVTVSTPDMVRQSVLAIVDARPDVILWLGRAQQILDYLPALREALGPVPIVGGDALNPIETTPDPNGLAPPMHFIRLVDLDARPETRRFRQRFLGRVGQEPTDAAALAYDAFRILLAGVAQGACTGDEMRVYLMSLGRERPAYQGITGPVRFDENGDVERDYVMGHLLGHAAGADR